MIPPSTRPQNDSLADCVSCKLCYPYVLYLATVYWFSSRTQILTVTGEEENRRKIIQGCASVPERKREKEEEGDREVCHNITFIMTL